MKNEKKNSNLKAWWRFVLIIFIYLHNGDGTIHQKFSE